MKHRLLILFIFTCFINFAQTHTKQSIVKQYQYVFNKLKLTEDQQDMLYEMVLIENDIEKISLELEKNKKLQKELTLLLSSENDHVRIRSVKKLEKAKNYEYFLLFDIQEYTNMEQMIAYQIFSNQIKIGTSKSGNRNKVKIINKEAQMQVYTANQNLKQISSDLTDEQFVAKMKEVNKQYEKAIQLQSKALELCYNIYTPQTTTKEPSNLNPLLVEESKAIPLMPNEDEPDVDLDKLYAQIHEISLNDSVASNKLYSLLDITVCNSKSILGIEQEPEIKKEIVFKVQVGAFYSDVKTNQFIGLSPIELDNTDSEYTKVVVGHYHSFKAAQKARDIICRNTNYKDAFVVAYIDGNRVTMTQAMKH
ncbi:MAG: SPOR domain-containing protein [Bacteroidales bacterium]|nr:SPOR domain-containing protein [Bacteroidales bacterium]